jgi:hypothetical protein
MRKLFGRKHGEYDDIPTAELERLQARYEAKGLTQLAARVSAVLDERAGR